MSDKKVYESKKGSKTTTTATKRSKISNRRPPNRWSMEREEENVSASAKKLRLGNKSFEADENPAFGYRILNFVAVFAAISESVVCKTCHSKITFTEASKRGLGFKIVINCENCEKQEINCCPLIGHAYKINRRIVLAMRLLGIGLHGIMKFCAVMDLPRPVFHSFYDSIVKSISIATAAIREKSMKEAAIEEKKLTEENGEINGITVSGDGSWRKRGYSSLFGLVTLIGWYTGKVVDVLVKSKYCKMCEYW